MRSNSENKAMETEEKETGRVEAFSDGVFAFAITLLALDVKIPHVAGDLATSSNAKLFAGLAQNWPNYLAFFTSFFSILIMWVHHHNVFRWVRKVDTRLLFANGFLLMVVTLVPFPTAVAAEYFESPAASAACAFYAGYFVLVAIAFCLMLYAALRKSLRIPRLPQAQVNRFCRSYRFGPLLYLSALGGAYISKWIAMGICTALWILWMAVARSDSQADAASE
jgi:uncharacterized membrane protein